VYLIMPEPWSCVAAITEKLTRVQLSQANLCVSQSEIWFINLFIL